MSENPIYDKLLLEYARKRLLAHECAVCGDKAEKQMLQSPYGFYCSEHTPFGAFVSI